MTPAPLQPLGGQRLTDLLYKMVGPRPCGAPGVCVVLDADRTLAAEDTGRLVGRALGVNDAIRAVFEARGYSAQAFSDVSTVWSRIPVEVYLDHLARAVADVALRPAWTKVLSVLNPDVPRLALTAGIPQAWELILARSDDPRIPVLGGCHAALDAYLVTAQAKAAVVRGLQALGWTVVAAGDSPIDLEMLRAADVPLFVPDAKGSPALRGQLGALADRVRHLEVDEQRFPELETCTAADVLDMLQRGGRWRSRLPSHRDSSFFTALETPC